MIAILSSYDGSFIENIFSMIIHAAKHALLIVPFLFLSYIIIEYVQHRHTKKINELIRTKGKYGPLAGASLGIIPQCGFSSTVATLYANKIVSIGTLFAVLISTSDEALLILIAYPSKYPMLLLLIGLKFILAIIFGFLIDFIVNKFKKEEIVEIKEVESKCCCKKEHSIFKSALRHTIQIFLFLCLFAFLVDLLVYFIGNDNLEKILLSGNIFQPILASVIGLIPNCAASVLLTDLYVSGSLSFASLISGLISNAGIGVLVLFKNNKSIKESFTILGVLLLIAISVGVLFSLISLLF